MATLPKNFNRMGFEQQAEFIADLVRSGETLDRASPRLQRASLRGPDEADDQPDPAASSLQIALAHDDKPYDMPVEQKHADFFRQHYLPVARMADELQVDPALILGLAAHESSWATSDQAKGSRNPFGATPNGQDPVQYLSTQAAWDKWKKKWGPLIRGVGGDVEKFISAVELDEQAKTDTTKSKFTNGRYNQEGRIPPEKTKAEGDPHWRKKVRTMIGEVRRRLPTWKEDWDSPR